MTRVFAGVFAVSTACVVVMLGGCSLALDGFICASSSSCGSGYECIGNACAAPDTKCSSGWRWDESAGSRRDECTSTVAPDSGDLGTQPDTQANVDSAVDLAHNPDMTFVCPANAFCETFEGDLSHWTLTPSNGATAEIDATVAIDGKSDNHAFHVVTQAYTSADGTGVTYGAHLDLDNYQVFNSSYGHDAYIRLDYYMTSPQPTDWSSLFTVQALNAAQNYPLLETSVEGQHTLSMDDGLGAAGYTRTDASVPASAWARITYHITDAAPETMEIGIDCNYSTATQTDTTTWAVPPTQFSLVPEIMAESADVGPHEVWIDNVVISPTDPGCD